MLLGLLVPLSGWERGYEYNSLVGWLGGAGDTLGGDGSGMWLLGLRCSADGAARATICWLAGWMAGCWACRVFSRGLIPGGASYHNSFLASRMAWRSTAGKCLAGSPGESPVQGGAARFHGLLAPYFVPGREYWRPSVKGVSASMLWGACRRVDPFNVELVSFTADGTSPTSASLVLSGWTVASSMTDSMSNARVSLQLQSGHRH